MPEIGPAGFGEREEETCPWESDCGPAAKAPDEPPNPTGLRASSRLYPPAGLDPHMSNSTNKPCDDPKYGLLYWPGMAAIERFLSQASGFVWGPLFLVPLLLFTGLYLTVRLRGLQFRQLPHALWLGLVVRREPDAEGDITHFQALMTALAATVGTGNIVGVATAIAAGGPGALFWMWMTGLVGMATKYSEALLSVRFRTTDPRGEQSGGPMYFLEHGVGQLTGRWLARAFALFAAAAAFGIGNMVQSNAISLAVANSAGTFGLSVHPGLVGLAVAVLAALVILGGIRSIGRTAATLVPSMILVYVTATTVILVPELRRDPRGDRARFPECVHRHGGDGRVSRCRRGADDSLRRGARHLLERVGSGIGGHCRRGGTDARAGAPSARVDDADLHRHAHGLLVHRACHHRDRRVADRAGWTPPDATRLRHGSARPVGRDRPSR